jgi:uncharacterized YccA/Bax inhibitor family protein
VVNKTALLLFFLAGFAGFTWNFVTAGNFQMVSTLMIGGLIGGFILSLVTIFKQGAAPFTAIPYACSEGLALGGLSAMFELRYPGIVMQAVGATFGTLFCLLAAYRSGVIRATEKFKLGVVAATGGICMLYLVNLIMSCFGVHMHFLHESGAVGIGFSVVVVIIAALNLILDFDFIEQAVAQRAPKALEWYSAFALIVTLVWLYLEILRLLSKLNRRD